MKLGRLASVVLWAKSKQIASFNGAVHPSPGHGDAFEEDDDDDHQHVDIDNDDDSDDDNDNDAHEDADEGHAKDKHDVDDNQTDGLGHELKKMLMMVKLLSLIHI